MPATMYDQIIVTGCSFSTGMEMNDHLLQNFENLRERESSILAWAKKNKNSMKSNSFKEFKNSVDSEWHTNERYNSWPALLQKMSGIPVTNLATMGACIGRSLIDYSNFLKNITNKKILTIHQIPYKERMYIRFDSVHGRVLVNPITISTKGYFGFDSTYFARQIKNVHEVYKQRAMNDGYIEKLFLKALARLENLSIKAGINNFYIWPTDDLQPEFIKDKVLLKDFRKFRSNYPIGKLGHPVGSKFNIDLCNKIISTCL